MKDKDMLWATDLHLDHCDTETRNKFYQSLRENDDNILLVSGDIANGKSLDNFLRELSANIKLYFILGNHDFYGSSISQSRKIASNYNYLTNMGVVDFGSIGLIGHDGWYDLRNGIPGRIIMNDFKHIHDFSIFHLLMEDKFRELAQQAADHFDKYLRIAFKKYDKVILVTHVPPFVESAIYNGKRSGVEFLPYYSSKVEGDILFNIMQEYVDKELVVLCGHTHGSGTFQPLHNLLVVTGDAEYKYPKIQDYVI